MKDPTTRHCIPPCAAYDVAAMQLWLEDMAAKGWRLSYDGFFCGVATFERSEPERIRFRLEATATNGGLLSEEYAPDDDAFQLNRQMGWEYRARRGQFHIYSTADPESPELNTDPVVQAMTIDTLGKYLRKSLKNTLVLFLLHFVLNFSNIVLTSAVTLGSWRVGLLIGLTLWELGRSVYAIVRLSKLKRSLQHDGSLPPPKSVPGYLHGLKHLARIALWIFVCASLLLRLGAGLIEEDAVPLEMYTDPLPFATLSDLYPDAEVKQMRGILDSDVTAWSDFLAPENYDYSEYAALQFSDGTKADCYLTVEYHRTRWEWTAAGLAREFVSQSGDNPLDRFADRLFGEEPTVSKKLDVSGADFASYYYKYRGSPYLVLQQGNTVIRVNLDFIGRESSTEPEELAEAILSHIG